MDASSPGVRLVESALPLHPKTVSNLLSICHTKNPETSEEEVFNALRILADEGRLSLQPPRFESLGKFLLSPYWDTNLQCVLAVSISSSALYFIAGSFPWSLFQIVPGILLIFYFPGHSLLRILLGRHTEQALERFILDVAASIVAVILLGLLLNFSGLGLFSAPALASVLVLNIFVAAWAAYEDFTAPWLRV